MKRYFYIGIAVILVLALGLVGYGAWLNYSDEHQIARRMDNRVIQLSTAKAEYRDIHPTVSLPAVRFSSDNMADAIALTDGRLTNWLVEKNAPVHKGDILVSLINEQIPLKIQQSSSTVSRAEAQLAQAYSVYQRQGRLMKKEATSQEKYEASEAQYLAAREALQEAEAQRNQLYVQQGWLNVKAPVDGDVLLVYQQTGSYVQAGTPVALVGNFDYLNFSVNLADSEIYHFNVGDRAYLRFPDHWSMGKAYDTDFGAGNLGGNTEIIGVLKEIVPPLSEPAAIRRTVWEVDNRVRILEPMTYTGVTMYTYKDYHCLTVPLDAMVDKSNDKVYVVDADGIVHLRSIKSGCDDGVYIEVLSGLSEGDAVVVGSVDGLSDGMKVNIKPEGGE